MEKRAAVPGLHTTVLDDIEVTSFSLVPAEHIGCLADVDLDPLVGGEGVAGQRQELVLLLGEDVAHGAAPVLRAAAIGGLARNPCEGLGVEVVEIDIRAGGEEGVAHVANGALDAPLLIAARGRDGAGLIAVVRRELDQRRVESDGVAGALQHGALEVVVEQHPRHAAEEGEGLDVAAEKRRHRRAREEAQEDLPREAQHHHEGDERPRRRAHGELAEVRPIDLGLLAGQRAQPQERLRRRPRPMARDDGAEVVGAARVAARLDHHVQAAGAEARVLGERLDDEGNEGIGDRSARLHRGDRAGLREHAPHGAVVMAELGADGANGPLLGVEEAEDLRLAIGPDHGAPRRRCARKSPSPDRSFRDPRPATAKLTS